MGKDGLASREEGEEKGKNAHLNSVAGVEMYIFSKSDFVTKNVNFTE